SRRARTVGEDVTEMRTARSAHDFGARHAHAAIGVLLDDLGRDRLPEAAPSRSALELAPAVEERLLADHTAVGAFVVAVPVDAAERPLGARMLRDLILQGIEALVQLGVAEARLGCAGCGGGAFGHGVSSGSSSRRVA